MKTLLFAAVFAALAGGAMAQETNRQTLVLATPKADSDYYAEAYDAILEFHATYVELAAPHDDVVILTDQAGYDRLIERVPAENLIIAPQEDIWMRDLSPVEPNQPMQFRYAAAAQGGDQAEADEVQDVFNATMDEFGVRYRGTELILDGGNYVSDGVGRGAQVIVTERFQDDNDLTRFSARKALQEVTGAARVAIIPSDDPDGLAHADGMVMFTEPRRLFINDYRDDPDLRADLLAELEYAFPRASIVELPVGNPGADFDPRFASACGIYVNATVTENAVYLPVFGEDLDRSVIRIMEQHTRKTVVPIPSGDICYLGGSARCLVWQTAGRMADRLKGIAAEAE